ncbi:hypothetical protein [Hymenobacter baengnokdamensis]|uniref:hypothetical protein n=1 Tax=Hymenobacter baengnokdamensis TaxID=2615203 RepID=UPI001243C29A|nr:hypothetical protein [Hymenobacter baengnokdamensis]
MQPIICLATRAEKKEWARNLATVCNIVAWLAAFGLFFARVLKRLQILYLALLIMGFCLCIQFGLMLIAYWKRSIIYYPKVAETIGLNEQSLVLGMQETATATLKSIVIESDGYAGKVAAGRRGPFSGNGKITVVDKSSAKEVIYLITIKSADELHSLRHLAESWRAQGISAFVMD